MHGSSLEFPLPGHTTWDTAVSLIDEIKDAYGIHDIHEVKSEEDDINEW